MGPSPGAVDPLLVGYVLAFGGAAVACFVSVGRARRVDDPDTRRGLVWLLVTSGGWAAAHVAFLLVPTPRLKVWTYLAGLVVGFSTLGPWLYFCSAFTGRSLHRDRTVRRVAVGVFLAVVLVKVTNPLHHLYFTTAVVTTPFPHLAVRNGLLHWLAMGLAYALASVGYFMLLELFLRVGRDATPLVGLVGVTGLPLVLDVAGRVSPFLLDITYEPIGVAVFAVGVLYLYFEEFRTVQLTGGGDDPVIVLDGENRVRDYNSAASDLFPDLASGEEISGVTPALAEHLDADDTVIEADRVGGLRYYRLTTNPFSTDQTRRGRVITLTDITDRERYRTEIERQNERLEQFAEMVSHDLRNPLNVAKGRLDLAEESADDEHVAAANAALDRMEDLIEDVLTLARQGQPIDELSRTSLAAIADRAWTSVETADASLDVESDLTFEADPDRLRQLLENLFRNAVEHGRSDATVRVGALDDGTGFYVADDGEGIPEADRDGVFESGYSTATDGTGFGLAIVEEIVDAHGWSVRVTGSSDGGARFEITGVDVES